VIALLPIDVVSVLAAIIWGCLALLWAVVLHWEASHMTDARRQELATERAEAPASVVKLVWPMVARGIVFGLPMLFVLDGLLFRVGILYSPRLSFLFGFELPLQITGVIMSVLGLAIMIIVGRTLAVRVYRLASHERAMITTGLHRYVRHPFYLHFVLLPVGLFLLTLNYLALLVLLFYTEFDGPVWLTTEVREEEDELLHRFGADYQEYADRTGRFLPRVRRR
jgi:protein-S-isoprenylcysteine O-methyltransferase Ste14